MPQIITELSRQSRWQADGRGTAQKPYSSVFYGWTPTDASLPKRVVQQMLDDGRIR